MAATNTLLATTNSTHGITYGRGNSLGPYMIEQTIDFSNQNIDPNGSTIECVDMPANSVCMFANIEVMTALTSDQTDGTIDLGISGGDEDSWVDGFDIDGASAGTYATVLVGTNNPQMVDAAAPLKMTFAGTGGTISAGVLRVFAIVMPVGDLDKTDEASRDMLA